MFNKQFFKKHQSKLLWLLNNPITKRWFRYCLRIRKHDCQSKITEITPNSISWGDRYFKKKGKWYLERTTDFRTYNKFSKRLFYAFYPLWYLCHCWDILIANNFKPAWNLGYDTLTVYPDVGTGATTCDAEIHRNAAAGTWASIRDGAGNTITTAEATSTTCTITSTTSGWIEIRRGGFGFDTSPLTSGATITAATFSFYVTGKAQVAYVDSFGLVGFTPATNNTFVVGDYANFGTTKFCDTDIAYASITTSAYNNWALNAAGISAISKTGVTNLGNRNATDRDNTPPSLNISATDYCQIGGAMADTAGTSQDPKLVVTYSIAVAGNNPTLLTMNVG